MKTTWLIRGLIVLGLAALVWWVADHTEWVNERAFTPAKGEAALNDMYALQRLTRALGARPVAAHNLDLLPPRGATLVLTSVYWDVVPERVPALQRWVRGGGHLVLHAGMANQEHLRDWVGVEFVSPKSDARDCKCKTGAPAGAASPASAAAGKDEDSDGDEETAQDAAALARDHCEPWQPMSADGRALGDPYKVCNTYRGSLRARAPALVALRSSHGAQLLRVAQGQGSVTVVNAWGLEEFWNNIQLFKGDHADLAVYALNIRPGRQVWFVDEETREPLLVWMWQHGAVALLGVLVTLALIWWRASARFGPLAAAQALTRRSMGEQVRGTAQFFRAYAPAALLGAQQRALEHTARRHLRDYRAQTRAQRGQALAAATGLPAAALERAIDPACAPTAAQLPATLQLLETARRRLLAASAVTSSHDSTPSQP